MIRKVILTACLFFTCLSASARADEDSHYSCVLNFSVTAKDGRFEGWGTWGSLWSAGPGQQMSTAHGTIIINPNAEDRAIVRMFGERSPFEWKVFQRNGRGNGWVFIGQVDPKNQGRGSKWPQIIYIEDYWLSSEPEFKSDQKIGMTYFDEGRTLYAGICQRV